MSRPLTLGTYRLALLREGLCGEKVAVSQVHTTSSMRDQSVNEQVRMATVVQRRAHPLQRLRCVTRMRAVALICCALSGGTLHHGDGSLESGVLLSSPVALFFNPLRLLTRYNG